MGERRYHGRERSASPARLRRLASSCVSRAIIAKKNPGYSLLLISAGLLNALLSSFEDTRPRMNAIARGWIMGRRAKVLFGTRWNELWKTDLSVLRRQLDVDLIGTYAAVPLESAA